MRRIMRIATIGQPWPQEPALRSAIATNGHTNAFNPSLAEVGSGWAVAYRALRPSAQKPFEAFLAETDSSAPSGWRIRSLSEQAAAHGIGPVADPKLFQVGDALCATFNTGYSPIQNDIYIMQLTPSAGAPQRCVLTGPRQQVEKNWAFFSTAGSVLSAIYQLGPYTELRLVRGTVGDGSDLVFERAPSGGASGAAGLTMGTPAVVDADRLSLIAHQKIRVGRRRAYLGRLVEIPTAGPPAGVPRASRTVLVHSFRTMLPAAGRHNPNLLSATYFSGVAKSGSQLVLGYGINDQDFGIRIVEERQLWS